MTYDTAQRNESTVQDDRRVYDEPDVHGEPHLYGEPDVRDETSMQDKPDTHDETGMHDRPDMPDEPDIPEQPGPAVGIVPAEEANTAEPGDLMPGEVPDAPLAALWPEDAAQGFRTRWQEIQLRFVDDPRAAAVEAEALLAEVLDVFTEALAARKAEMDDWGSVENLDTEQMRMTIRRYRDLLDQLLRM